MITGYIEELTGDSLYAIKAHDSITDKTVTVVLKQTKMIAKRFAKEMLDNKQFDTLQEGVRLCQTKKN